MDAETDLLLEKACSTQQGQLKASYALAELAKLAPAYHNEATRPAAVAVLESWASGPSELKKGLALAWLARARSTIAAGASKASGAVRAVEGKAGNVGAAAGEKIARSPLNAAGLAAARHAGGAAAADRMAARLRPNHQHAISRAPQRMTPQEAGAPRFLDEGAVQAGTRSLAPAGAAAVPLAPHGPQIQRDTAPSARLDLTPNLVHQKVVADAYAAGAKFAGEAHVGSAARHGRVAAKYAFRAGLALGGAGAAGAGIHAVLSDSQRKQRSEAGKHSHHGGGQGVAVAKAADGTDLRKMDLGIGRSLGTLAGQVSGLAHVAGAPANYVLGQKGSERQQRHEALKTALTAPKVPGLPKVPGATP